MRNTAIAIALVVGVAALAAQQPPARQAPTFRVEVNYVEIDATVIDAQGNFVRGLTKDDFELVEEGKPQTISAFTMVDLPIARADPPLFRGAVVEPDVRSNIGEFDGRVILIVLDDLQTDFRRTHHVRRAAAQFVRRFVGVNDLVAVVNDGRAHQRDAGLHQQPVASARRDRKVLRPEAGASGPGRSNSRR